MGRVHGERKLNTPAMNAKKVKTSMPDGGRLDLTSNGFDGDVASSLADNREVLGVIVFSVAEVFIKLFDRVEVDKLASFIAVGIFSLVQRNPTSNSG